LGDIRRFREYHSASMRPRMLLLLCVAAASGTVAGWVGQATAGKPRTAVLRPPRVIFGRCPVPERFRPAFEEAARQSGLPLALLAAVANQESTFNPDARSPAGAHGLFQILPSTAKALKLDTSTPEKNILAGAKYLRLLLDEFRATDLMLAAYNAGPTAVIKAHGAPNNASIAYVQEVMSSWKALNGCR
jgi:soluble lytic murein transglycosylase-like protein